MRIKYILLTFWALLFLVFLKSCFICNVSDKEAIALTKTFCKNIGITYVQEPRVTDTRLIWITDLNSRVKEVRIGKINKPEFSANINCKRKEIESFNHGRAKDQIMAQYNIPYNTTLPHNWPPFLPEEKAKERLFAVADKIGLPSDVEFSKLVLDKDAGEWSGFWQRKYKGFPYENDGIRIDIMAVNGDFYHYGKGFHGKPCPTEVNLSKEQAINKAWEDIIRRHKFPPNEYREAYRKAYEASSAELKIVQPQTFLGVLTHCKRENSRLAWVVKTRLELEVHENVVTMWKAFTIKVDAANGDIIGENTEGF